MKLTELQEFFKCFPDFMWQTFNDNKPDFSNIKDEEEVKRLTKLDNDKHTRQVFGQLSERVIRDMIALNTSTTAGIFFTPNGFPKFPKGEKLELCSRINAWYVESDKGSINEQYERLCNSPLEPSIMIKTKSSIHAYWLVKGEASRESFKNIALGLCDVFQGDTACAHRSRVLRVPGFYHQKKGEKTKVELLKKTYDMRYTEEEMIKAFPHKEEVKTEYIKSSNGDMFWDWIGDLNCKSALINLSGSSMVQGETYSFRHRQGNSEYIDINGKVSGCWLDESGLIGSDKPGATGKGGGPTIIQWLEWYGNTKAEIATWAKDTYGAMMPDHVKYGRKPAEKLIILPEKKSDIEFPELEIIEHPFTWGTPELDKEITALEPGDFIILVGSAGAGKTTYAFDMAIKNAKAGKKVLYLSLEMDRDAIHQRYARNFASVDKAQWRDRRMEDWQRKAYIKAKRYIISIENLTLQGFNLDVPITTANILEYLKGVKDEYDLVYVDNFGNIAREGSQLEHEMSTSRSFAGFTKQVSLAIILVHHFKKCKGNGLRGLEDLSGSAKFGDHATDVIQVWRDVEGDPSITKIVEMKDRGFGVRGWVNVKFNKGIFSDTDGSLNMEQAQAVFNK